MKRQNNRLSKDLYQGGYWYFITLCTYNMQCIFVESAPSPTQNTTEFTLVLSPTQSRQKYRLNHLGKIIEKVWLNTTQCYSDVIFDEYVIMPNHFHSIIGLDENSCSLVTGKKVSLGDVVSSFKRVSLREFKESVGGGVRESVGEYLRENVGEGADSTKFKVADFTKFEGADSTKSTLNKYGTFWQKSFYDHIIRNDKDLFRIQEYIINNPINWELDSLHPNNFNK